MKNMKLVLTAAFCLLCLISIGQTQFQKTLGGSADDDFWSVQEGPNGNWLLVGRTTSFSTNGIFQAYAVALDQWGNIIWEKVYDDGNINWFCDVVYNGTDYIVTGRNEANGDQDVLIMRLDPANGDILDQWTYDQGAQFTFSEYGRTMDLMANGDVLVAGYTQDLSLGGNKMCLLQVDPGNGNTQNSWLYNPTTFHEFGDDVAVHNSNQGYAMVGDDGSKTIAYVSFYDNSNALVWQTQLSDGALFPTTTTRLRSIIATDDDGYAAVGDWNGDMLLIKFANGGGVQWWVCYAGNQMERGHSLIQTSDGGYALQGTSNSWSANGDADLFMVKTSSNGALEWAMTYGGGQDERSAPYGRLHEMANGGYLFGASTSSFGAGGRDFYFIRTNEDGESGCNEQTVSPNTYTPLALTPQNPNYNAVTTSHSPLLAQTVDASVTTIMEPICQSCDRWHKTSASNHSFDEGNDVATDIAGNVYTVGTYNLETSFDQITIPSVGPSYDQGMFLVKHNECGEVLWAAYSMAPNQFSDELATGNGLVLDELNHRIYVTGKYIDPTTAFYGGDGSTTPLYPSPILGMANGLYITEYDMSTGAILSIRNYEEKGADLQPAAITMDEDHELFVVGTATDINSYASFLYKPAYAPATEYYMQGEYQSQATDIEASKSNNRLYITGIFKHQIQFNHPFFLSNSASRDGYLAWVTDQGSSASFDLITQAGISGSGPATYFAELNGVSVDMYGFPCVVGSFNGGLSNPLTSSLAVSSSSTNQSSLLVARVHPSATWGAGSWLQTSTNGADETGQDIDCEDHYLFVVGDYDGNFSIQSKNSIFFGPGQNMFQSSFDLTSGFCHWISSSTGDRQQPRAIAADQSLNVFCTGHYSGLMNLWAGGVPVLNGAPLGNTFCYTSRVDGTYGGFYDIVGAEEPVEKSLEAYPNPTDGLMRIQLENVATSVQVDVLNEIGQTVKTQRFGETATLNLDLGDLGAGIYFLSTTTNEGGSYYQKIIVH